MHYEARPVSMAHNVSLAEFWYEKFPWNHVTTFILMATHFDDWIGFFANHSTEMQQIDINLAPPVDNALLCEVPINSIDKSFFFFHPHLHIKSNKSAYIAGICFRM